MSDRREPYDGDGGPGLPEELRSLGRSLDRPGADGPETMVERVLGQILAESLPVPVAEPARPGERLRSARRWTRVRWRSLTVTFCGLLAVLVLTPPVRATVLDWFDFGGVGVRYDPSARPTASAEVIRCERSESVSLARAERQAGFAPAVPPALGRPDAVTVTEEPDGRFLVSLCWQEGGGTVRLDEFPERLDIGFVKTVREQPEFIALGDTSAPDPALWFARPHLLSFWLVGEDGSPHTRKERTAGPTLLWTHGAGTPDGETLTLRLEGVPSKERAVEIAKSLKKSSE
ncbi:hypothetical protein Stsp02_06340 [Streptomyces sp. NBRC 14336]|uniref:hypothetical protein n=1 Tax=Streptomyces sp. NBRC 14336 TaxID=3030992 RepID=UPI0024A07F08|nr:hypothetical protein [Streptomyces sp. NBRC 14336]WBO79923.1 hypothetical protein SBE_003659 [Streptomyces sp. SBE_14.2]GLW44972.1 hypothetical protein Stsp02_06340 [Streptomyces sp. NBRC 14336]